VNVGPNDSTVEVSVSGTGSTSSTDVPPGKTVSVPIPDVPGGTFLFVTVGKGARRRTIIVQVIAPPP
jgi:hypothetical protein